MDLIAAGLLSWQVWLLGISYVIAFALGVVAGVYSCFPDKESRRSR